MCNGTIGEHHRIEGNLQNNDRKWSKSRTGGINPKEKEKEMLCGQRAKIKEIQEKWEEEGLNGKGG